jgi:hypothetical protein
MEIIPWKKNMEVRLQVKRITSDLVLHPEEDDTLLRSKMCALMKIMRSVANDRVILQLCLHSLCQISMNPILVDKFLTIGCHQDIARALKRHNSWKLAWYGCSTIWNLSKVEDTRDRFDGKTIEALFFTLEKHQSHSKIVSTCLSALSELGLSDIHRSTIATRNQLKRIFAIIRKNASDGFVASSGCGLIAALAKEYRTEKLMVDLQVFSLLSMLANHWVNRMMDSSTNFDLMLAKTLCRLSRKFPKHLVRNRLIEVLFQLHENSIGEVKTLCNLAFLSAAPKISFSKTSSIHIASALGWLDELKYLLQVHGENDLNLLNFRNESPMDVACDYRSFPIIFWFSFAGIRFDHFDPKVRIIIKRGKLKKKENELKFALALYPLQGDVAKLVLSFGTRIERALSMKRALSISL